MADSYPPVNEALDQLMSKGAQIIYDKSLNKLVKPHGVLASLSSILEIPKQSNIYHNKVDLNCDEIVNVTKIDGEKEICVK